MKRVYNSLVVFLLYFISINSFSQQNELKKITDEMFQFTNNRDFDALMDMTYPKVFEMVPKETMKNFFVSMFEGNDEVKIDLPKQNPGYEISDIYNDKSSKTDYAFLTYDMVMSMIFTNQSFNDEEKVIMIDALKVQSMEAKFETDKKINVFAPNRMIIFLKNETSKNKWSMLNYEVNSSEFDGFLPAPILEKAKTYYQDILSHSKKKN